MTMKNEYIRTLDGEIELVKNGLGRRRSFDVAEVSLVTRCKYINRYDVFVLLTEKDGT